MKKRSFAQILIQFRTILILIVLALVFYILKPVFMHPTNLLNMVKRMSYVAITAFGMTFIMTLGGLDLSGGSIAALTGVILAWGLNKRIIYHFFYNLFGWEVSQGVQLGLMLLIVIALSILMGFLNGYISVKGKIAPFLVTLATMNIFRGAALTLTSGRTVAIKVGGFADFWGNGKIAGIVPSPCVIMAVLFVVMWFLFKRTKFGYFCRCIGGNAEAARVAGIPVEKIQMSAYTLNGLLACLAGLIMAALMNAGIPDQGETLSMDAITAVVLGGTAISGGIGTMWGTLGGTFIMAILNTGLALMGAQTPVQILVKGIVVILAVLMDNAFKSRQTTQKEKAVMAK